MRSVRDRIITAICDEALRNPGVTAHFGTKAADGNATILGWTFNVGPLADAIIEAIKPEVSETPGVKGTIDAVKRMSDTRPDLGYGTQINRLIEMYSELRHRVIELEQTAPRVVPCKACNGTGASGAYAKANRGVEVCPGCNGAGVQRV